MNDIYNKWLEKVDEKTKEIILNMTEEEKEESFSSELQFGTAGVRALTGVGSNKLNKYTVTKIMTGYAKYLVEKNKKSVVISYDSRETSLEFATITSEVLSSFNISVFLFNEHRSTPELSFAVRALNAGGGVMITASHNPLKYNGIKLYDEFGCQLVDKLANELLEFINEVDVFNINIEKKEELIKKIDNKFDLKYLDNLNYLITKDCSDTKVIYNPLQGLGSIIMPEVLKKLKCDFKIVEEQLKIESSFSNTPYLNPEDIRSFENTFKYEGDLFIASDPDADRLGVAVFHNNEKINLTGNQMGALYLNYLIETENIENSYIVDSVVSSLFAETIAKENNVEVYSVYTGFKNIAGKIEETKNKKFLFGYEESIGYLFKDFVRDKDSHQAAIMAVQMVSYYKKKNKTLIDVLNDLYKKYGIFKDETLSYYLPKEKIDRLMKEFRFEKKSNHYIDYLTLLEVENDIAKSIDFEPNNILKLIFENGFLAIRPSGTEPKIKFYLSFNGEKATEKIEEIKDCIECKINKQL